MLQLITENKFQESIISLGSPKIIKGVNNMDLLSRGWPYYMISEESFLIWIKPLRKAIIYGSYDGDINTEILDFSGWTLEKLSDIPSRDFILNKMKKHVHIDDNFYEVCGKGDWLIKNQDGLEIRFTIKTSGSYFVTTAIGYPDKNQKIIKLIDIIKKDRLIEEICYGIRKINKKCNF